MQDQPAAQGAEHAFQAHDQAGDGGVQIFLPQDLQGVGDPAGQHTAVEQRQQILAEFREGRVLEQESGSGAFHRHHQKLQQAQPHTVHQRRKMIHRHDLETEQHGAAQQDPVAGLDAAETVLHAQQPEPAHGDDHAQPEPGIAPPPQKQAEHRHQHHIHGGEETGLCRGGVQGDADLLGGGGRKQQGAAAETGGQQVLAVGGGFGPAIGSALPAAECVKGINGGHQHQNGQPAASGQKGISPHAGACALGHEGRAPDKGAEHQHERMSGLCVHQPIPTTFIRP